MVVWPWKSERGTVKPKLWGRKTIESGPLVSCGWKIGAAFEMRRPRKVTETLNQGYAILLSAPPVGPALPCDIGASFACL